MKFTRTRMVVFAGVLGLAVVLPGCNSPSITKYPEPIEKPDSTDKPGNDAVRTLRVDR